MSAQDPFYLVKEEIQESVSCFLMLALERVYIRLCVPVLNPSMFIEVLLIIIRWMSKEFKKFGLSPSQPML
jgi:hypothetical protein